MREAITVALPRRKLKRVGRKLVTYKISLAIFGLLALAAAGGSATAAPIQIGDHAVNEEDAASFITTISGTTEIFDKFGTGVATQTDAISGSLLDGVRCTNNVDGCAFTIGFDFDVVNNAGDDLIIAGLGLVPDGIESFALQIGGFTQNDLSLAFTGVMLGVAPLKALTIDLSSFGFDIGEAIREITIIVGAGINTEEFTYFAAYNDDDVLVNPIPGAVWLFGSAVAAGGWFQRRKKSKAA